MKTFDQIAELERSYLLGTYNQYPIELTRGKGVFLYDTDDRRYLDCSIALDYGSFTGLRPTMKFVRSPVTFAGG